MTEPQINTKRIESEPDDEKAITEALARANRKALLFHKQTGNPIYIWENGRVVKREAKDIKID
ncbi:MAG: hypothetical protein P9X24_12340 [Candidatus Hatepunaea meridiana]|nr:hypothetical protein [Candidatus Hatepunaea meridiana]